MESFESGKEIIVFIKFVYSWNNLAFHVFDKHSCLTNIFYLKQSVIPWEFASLSSEKEDRFSQQTYWLLEESEQESF